MRASLYARYIDEVYMKSKLLLLLCITNLANVLHAADEVVVTPANYTQNANAAVPSVIVINKKMIQQSSAIDLADLLRWYAGIDIARTGGIGQQTSTFIRGTNSNHSAVLINGIKMNSATTGAPALEAINVSAIERIEVVKGPRSTVYGSEALGGVINIITTSDEIENHAEIHISSGRYSTTEQGFDFKYANEYVISDLSFNRLESDGFPAAVSSSTDHGHDNDSLDMNIKTSVGKLGIVFGYWQADGYTEYDGFGVDLDQDRKNDLLSTVFTFPFNEYWDAKFSISKTNDEIRQNQMNFLGDEDFAFTNRIVYGWNNELSLFDTKLSFGAAIQDEEAESLSFGTRYKEKTSENSFYLNHQIDFGGHSFFASTRYVEHDDFGDEILWNADYAYAISDKVKVFASYGTGFRAPDSNARFGFGGNTELKEETSRSIELGASYKFNSVSEVSLRLYENKIEDLIETILIDPGAFVFENRNVSQARIQGLEVAFRHQSDHWDVNLQGSVKEPINETDDSLLLRRAKRSLHTSVAYKKENYFMQLNGLLSSERSDFGGAELPGYGLFNLSAGMHFPYSTLSVKVENAFDKDYELASGFNTPGQSVFAELSVNFTE